MIELPMVVLGSGGVGKSSLTIQFIQGHFIDRYDTTIQDTYRKPVQIGSTNCVLSIIDTAGQDSFASMRESYMKRCKGFILVYSITDAESFYQMKKIYGQLRRVRDRALKNQPYTVMIVGNKTDLAGQRAVTSEEGESFAKNYGHFREVSAKLSQPTAEIFTTVVNDIIQFTTPPPSDPLPPQPLPPPQDPMAPNKDDGNGNRAPPPLQHLLNDPATVDSQSPPTQPPQGSQQPPQQGQPTQPPPQERQPPAPPPPPPAPPPKKPEKKKSSCVML